MERVQLTRDCAGLSEPRSDSTELYHFPAGSILPLLSDDQSDFHQVAFRGRFMFVPKSSARRTDIDSNPPAFQRVDLRTHGSGITAADDRSALSGKQAPETTQDGLSLADKAHTSDNLPPRQVESSITPASTGGREIPRGPLVVGALALLVAFGSSQTWARALFIAIDGTETDRGIITLLAGLALAGVSAWRAFLGLRIGWYISVGILLSGVAIVMPLWFTVDVYTEGKGEFFDEEVQIVTPGWALFLTIIAAVGCLVSLGWQGLRPQRQG